ncbi:MAG: hypothetical protein DRI73_11470 [Bacteroidetes bacterium]|nr:MAG: hypothetical protein DRI73_11470 [Bacteroidota bacterium]
MYICNDLKRKIVDETHLDSRIRKTYYICMWSFSDHIMERIEEREISGKEILSIVNNSVDIIIVPSSKDKTVDLYFGEINDKYIVVVVNRETNNLITTRKMRKNEKMVFNVEVKNGKAQN